MEVLSKYKKTFSMNILYRKQNFDYIFSSMKCFYDDLYSTGICWILTVLICMFTIYYKIINDRKRKIGIELCFGVGNKTAFLRYS